MRNTINNTAIVILIILLSACASNKSTTSVNNGHDVNNQAKASNTDHGKKTSNSISDDDYDRY